MNRPHIRDRHVAIVVGVAALLVSVCAFDDAFRGKDRPIWARILPV